MTLSNHATPCRGRHKRRDGANASSQYTSMPEDRNTWTQTGTHGWLTHTTTLATTYSVSNSIANTTDEALYQDERWDPSAQPDLLYDIPIDNGDYDVVLHFAEVYLRRCWQTSI